MTLETDHGATGSRRHLANHEPWGNTRQVFSSLMTFDMLEPGDILFRARASFGRPLAEFDALMHGLYQLVLALHKGQEIDQDNDDIHALTGFAVSYWDQSPVQEVAFCDGRRIIQVGRDGLNAFPIETYPFEGMALARYHAGGVALGDPFLAPVPVIWRAHELLERTYMRREMASCHLVLALALWRRSEDGMEHIVRSMLMTCLGRKHAAAIEHFMQLCGDRVAALLRVFLHRAATVLTEATGLVCADMVATLFNGAEPYGRYELQRGKAGTAPTQFQGCFEPLETKHVFTELSELGTMLSKIRFAHLDSKGQRGSAPAEAHSMWTPGDMLRSPSFFMLGVFD